MIAINYLAVLVAAIANFIIGFLLHGPIGGKLWMKLANIHPTGKEKISDMIPQMIKNFVANIVFAYALAVIIMLAATSTLSPGAGISTGICMAIIVWLGFIVTATSIDVIWMGKSYKLWLYEAFCSLVSLVAMGAIIAAW